MSKIGKYYKNKKKVDTKHAKDEQTILFKPASKNQKTKKMDLDEGDIESILSAFDSNPKYGP